MKCGHESNAKQIVLGNKEVNVCTLCNCYDPYDVIISFGNRGTISNVKNESENIRGKRARFFDWSDCNIDTEMIESAVADYVKNENRSKGD